MGIDINLLRTPEAIAAIRESEKCRCRDPKLVNDVVAIDEKWRKLQYESEYKRKLTNICSKAINERKKNQEPDGEDLPVPKDVLTSAKASKFTIEQLKPLNVKQIMSLSKFIQELAADDHEKAAEAAAQRDLLLNEVGNVIHPTVAIGSDEDRDNILERTFGNCVTLAIHKLSHVDIMLKLGGMDCSKQVTQMAGGRSYVLRGPLVQLQLALITFSMNFLFKKGFTSFYPPFFLNKDTMSRVAQLSDFDEMLYKVTGEGDDKYLIATSEMPICAYQCDKWYAEMKNPIRYSGMSSCFRKEVGSHGRDTLGIFRVHQFDKIEQFVICSPNDNVSWQMHEEMCTNAEDLCKALGLPYRIVNICSGALNNAAAKKYDLEGWFPGSGAFRELCSVSNCTDYQARAVNCRFGLSQKNSNAPKEYVHMLNGTCCAVTRTMCCICENFQTDEGVVIPEVLRPYMGGMEIMRYADADQIPA